MNKKLTIAVCLVAGVALIVSTGGVPGHTDEIHANVHVYPHPEHPGGYAHLDGGELVLDISSETAEGVAPNTRLWADDVFVVHYTGEGSVAVRIADNASDVTFYRGTYPDDVTSVEEEPIVLNESESVGVGVFVDTAGRSAGDRMLESVSFDVSVDEPAERTSLRVQDDDESAAFDVTDVAVRERETTIGSEVAFSVTVRNTGPGEGEFVLDLSTQDDRLALYDVTVPAGENVTWMHTHAFDAPGTYDVLINGVRYGSIVVADGGDDDVTAGGLPGSDETTTPTETTTSTTEGTNTGTVQVELSGVGHTGLLVVALIAVTSTLLLGVRRFGGDER